MSDFTVDLFAEDRAHEALLKALLLRVAHEEEKRVLIHIRSARGGHGRALSELALYQRTALAREVRPDLLVVCIDANCTSPGEARREIERHISEAVTDRAIVTCPDPHIERWYLADPDSFQTVVGVRPSVGKRKCEQGRYKAILSRAIQDAGHPPTLGGIEFAQEIVAAMDLFRAGKSDASLKHFLTEVRGRVRSL